MKENKENGSGLYFISKEKQEKGSGLKRNRVRHDFPGYFVQ